MTKAKAKRAKKYTRRATNKNVKCDDLIASRKNEIFRVWSVAGGMTNIPVLHKLDANRKFVYQSPRNLMAIKDGAPFFHLDEKYVEPPPKVPKPTEEYTEHGRAALGWIAPDGRFFGCNYGMHNALSYQLHFHEIDNKAERGTGYFQNDNAVALEKAGWLKVFTGSGSADPVIGSPEPHVRELSRAQGDTVLLYSEANKKKVPYWLDPVTYEVG